MIKGIFRNMDKHKIVGVFSVVYGIVFIVLDKIDYLIEMDNENQILCSFSSPESIMLRIPNVIFSIGLIGAGYFLIHKKKESWFLYSFSCIGILVKYIFVFFFVSAKGNFLDAFGIHFILAICGLVFINRIDIGQQITSKKMKYILFILVTLGISFFYGFEDTIFKEMNKRKHFKEVIYGSHSFTSVRLVDSCFFAPRFLRILDTLENINEYSQLQILQFDSISKPIYGEKLSMYEQGVLSNYYVYDDHKRLIKLIQEENAFSHKLDTMIYTYYENDKVKTITNLHYFLLNYDTTTYHYNYLNNDDTVFYSNDKNYNYCYNSYLNNRGNVVKTEQVKVRNIFSEKIEYEYDSEGELMKITKSKGKDKSTELFFYDQNGCL